MLAVSARARGEKQHGVGAGRPHSWRLRLGFSPNEAWRAWQRSRFGSAFEREASGRDAAFRSKKPVAWFGSCARANRNGWTKKSDVELVQKLLTKQTMTSDEMQNSMCHNFLFHMVCMELYVCR